ncbi:unnamed protein product [Rhodiola kirilowii]
MEDGELSNFLSWAAQLGVSDSASCGTTRLSCLGHSLAVSDFPEAGGRGLGAVRNLRKGELILRVPKSALLTRDNVMSGDQRLSLAVVNHPTLSSTQILAVCLLWELGKKRSSKWYPYLKHLPRCYFTLSTFDQFQMQMLQVDEAIWAAEMAASKAEYEWKGAISLMEEIELKPQLRTLRAWLWASATISSRTLHIPWDDAGCLCPVGDLFNYAAPGDEPNPVPSSSPWLDETVNDKDVLDKLHVHQSDAHAQRLTDGGFNDADATYCFYARENYRKGEQVLLGYGLYTNLELLEHYGFLLSSNPNDKVFVSLTPDMNYCTSWSKDLLYIDHSGKPSYALLSALRLWATPPNQRKSVSHLAYSGLRHSRQNEIIVMKWLVKKCHEILKTLPTTVEEDSSLLQTLEKVQCLGDIMKIKQAAHLTVDHEVHYFFKLHHLPEEPSRAKLSEKLIKSIETWKLAVLWRLGYKKILHNCITYFTETLRLMEEEKKTDVESGVDLVEKKKRKKKEKKKKRHEVAYESVKIDTSVEKKKKKKRHEFVNDVVSEHVESETGALEVKKMKKKKSRFAPVDVQNETTNATDCLEIDSSVKKKTPDAKKKKKTPDAKKKKKKRHEAYKDENIRSDSMDDARSSDVGTDTKRKKKQRKTKESLTESLAECENNVSKKKRHKGDRLSEEVDRKITNNKDKLKTAKAVLGSADGAEKVKEKELSKKVKKRKRNADDTESSKKSKSEKKRVRFSDTVEVLNLPEHLKYRKLNSEGDLVQGKRYTPEEDAKIMKAVDDYIVEHGLASDGVDKDLDENWKKARSMIMNCKKHPELMGCWKVISAALPCRTVESVYQRAHLVYERAEEHNWTKEEIDMILSFHEKNGPKWRELGDFLGKSRKHVKDAYRRNKLSDAKKGAWSQEEYRKLFELVNRDVCIKAVQEKKVKHGMLRDNIAWGAISESLGTRASPACCNKWYNQICSSMVVEGKWSDTDDYKLVDALYNQDACCFEDVDWDNLLEHRSGDLCQKRWAEMARNLGDYRQKPFLEQVEVLHQRYDQALIEAREIYEKKDPVDVKMELDI